MPQSVIHEMLYMKHPTRLKILQGVFFCSDIYVTSPETGAENFSEITDAEAKHEPLVYRVEEIAQLLAIFPRAAYNLCNTTKDFRVLRIGTSIRVNKQSFDNWFAAV